MSLLEKYKALFKRKETIKKDSVFEMHTVSGVNFRVIKDFGSNGYSRYIAYIHALESAGQGMVVNDILAACEYAELAHNAGDYAASMQYVAAIKSNLVDYNNTKSLFDVANTFILLDKEDENNIQAWATLQKSELCKLDKKVEFFFIKNALDILKGIGVLSKDGKIEDYLNSANRKVEQISSSMIFNGRYSK